ncbi:MAG: DUF3667 domain-containing protein [Acidobacteria bacterium]|nr:MAG: DUF3667 domain-containing protein [Acidobacteriota bacterium]
MDDASTPPAGGSCLNCGRPAGPRFCGHCGQEIEARRGPLLPLLREILADWLSLDGTFLRTLAALLRPGRLTERYLAGRRTAYLRPFRLYLVASLLLFSSLLSLRAPDAGRYNLYVAGQLVTESPPVKGRPNLTLFQPKSPFDRWLARLRAAELERLRDQPPQEILDALFSGLRRVLPGALIFFVPFLALGLKLLYRRSGVLFVDHLIFALHLQSALFFALAGSWLVCRLLGASLFASLLTYVLTGLLMLLIYLPLALHRVYRQRRRWTMLKALLLVFIYSQVAQLVLGGAMLLVTLRL